MTVIIYTIIIIIRKTHTLLQNLPKIQVSVPSNSMIIVSTAMGTQHFDKFDLPNCCCLFFKRKKMSFL